jgi:hypothetical protein
LPVATLVGLATVTISAPFLHLRLSLLEKLEAFHGDLSVALSSIREVRAVPNAWPELRGIRAPGTGIPGVIAVGTRRGNFGKDFAVVHGPGPAIVIELEGEPFARLVVTSADADELAPRVKALL